MTTHIGMLLFPGLTQLDLTGPFELLHRAPNSQVHLVWKSLAPVRADSGMQIIPDTTFADCPQLDVIVVPGGNGQIDLMEDEEVLGFLRTQAKGARYITSVCTGSLVLGAAGLLEGYAATSHWAYTDLLEKFGARFTKGRVVVDRNRITAGGVTAGIDFGLRLLTELAGEQFAKCAQLTLEYDPAPPYDCGHPDRADAETIRMARERFAARAERRRASAARAATALAATTATANPGSTNERPTRSN